MGRFHEYFKEKLRKSDGTCSAGAGDPHITVQPLPDAANGDKRFQLTFQPDPAVRTLLLLRGQHVMHTYAVAAEAPTISIAVPVATLPPAGGESLSVKFKGEDPCAAVHPASCHRANTIVTHVSSDTFAHKMLSLNLRGPFLSDVVFGLAPARALPQGLRVRAA